MCVCEMCGCKGVHVRGGECMFKSVCVVCESVSVEAFYTVGAVLCLSQLTYSRFLALTLGRKLYHQCLGEL